MAKQIEVLAVIPARGNSKSIPQKNIREFGGFPLVAYSISAGLQAACVTRTIVSTDDEGIAAVARAYGAEVPFLRPSELAQDDTLDLPVFQHALNWLSEKEGYHPSVVVQLRPTSPFRPPDMVDRAVQLLLDHPKADSVRGIVPTTQNPYKMWRIHGEGFMVPLIEIEGIKEAYNAPRQDLPGTYWQTGHIDAIRPEVILKKNSMNGDVILPLFIDPAYTVDIDTLLDWQRAESMLLEGSLEVITPGRRKRSLSQRIKYLVMDFDGVMTDDRVWVDQEGKEMIAANRSDGLGLERLRKLTDIEVLVISRETNPVVSARCKKLGLSVLQGIHNKAQALQKFIDKKVISPEEILYIGNDVNDEVCFPLVGMVVTPADAQPVIRQQADHVLEHKGGFGAVRELCELLISHFKEKGQSVG